MLINACCDRQLSISLLCVYIYTYIHIYTHIYYTHTLKPHTIVRTLYDVGAVEKRLLPGGAVASFPFGCIFYYYIHIPRWSIHQQGTATYEYNLLSTFCTLGVTHILGRTLDHIPRSITSTLFRVLQNQQVTPKGRFIEACLKLTHETAMSFHNHIQKSINHNTGVLIIVSPSTAALSQRKPAQAGISRESFRAPGNDKSHRHSVSLTLGRKLRRMEIQAPRCYALHMFILGFVVNAFTDKMFNETRIELFFYPCVTTTQSKSPNSAFV